MERESTRVPGSVPYANPIQIAAQPGGRGHVTSYVTYHHKLALCSPPLDSKVRHTLPERVNHQLDTMGECLL